MSYRGINYYILKDKTLVKTGCFDDPPENVEWVCHVNTTNGIDDDDPTTHEPKMKEVGFADEWHVDHHGNRYATKILHYEPENGFGLNVWEKYQEA